MLLFLLEFSELCLQRYPLFSFFKKTKIKRKARQHCSLRKWWHAMRMVLDTFFVPLLYTKNTRTDGFINKGELVFLFYDYFDCKTQLKLLKFVTFGFNPKQRTINETNVEHYSITS